MEVETDSETVNSLSFPVRCEFSSDKKSKDFEQSVISNGIETSTHPILSSAISLKENRTGNHFKADEISQEVAFITGHKIPTLIDSTKFQIHPHQTFKDETSLPFKVHHETVSEGSQDVPCENTENFAGKTAVLLKYEATSGSSKFNNPEDCMSPSGTHTDDSVSESPLDCQEQAEQTDLENSSARSRTSDVSQLLLRDSSRGHLSEGSKRRKRCKEWRDICPICHVTLRMPELQSHYDVELEKLKKLSRLPRKQCFEKDKHKQTFLQIKYNRENRLTAKVARFNERAKNEVKCPVCQLRLSGCQEDINKHVGLCYQNEDIFDEDVVVDEDEEEFEEYEIGDETRIRAISLVPGGHRALDGNHNRQMHNEDEEVDIVDIDTVPYGEPQYTELDLITSNNLDDEGSNEQLRKSVVMNLAVQPIVIENRKWSISKENDSNSETQKINMESSRGAETGSTHNLRGNKNDSTTNQVVSSLKEKIKNLEDEDRSVKCLICMEPYTKPVVSTTCWHVHCEECWLMTMGVKKLCPQCNMIVFPSDLRKIYL